MIKSDRLRVTATAQGTQGYDFGDKLFSELNNFSLSTAFGNVAKPALVGASQPNQKGVKRGSARSTFRHSSRPDRGAEPATPPRSSSVSPAAGRVPRLT